MFTTVNKLGVQWLSILKITLIVYSGVIIQISCNTLVAIFELSWWWTLNDFDWFGEQGLILCSVDTHFKQKPS